MAIDYVASFLDRLRPEEAQRFYERYVGSYFTTDGDVDLNIAQRGVDAVAAEPGAASIAAKEVYQTSVGGHHRAGPSEVMVTPTGRPVA